MCSGGQIGVDFSALKTAKLYGIPTGGWMPKGWKTLDGPKPEYKQLYGMKEHSSAGYKERTWDNVFMADGTLRLAHNFNSPGEKCTLNAIKAHAKPYFDVEFTLHCGLSYLTTAQGGYWLTNKTEDEMVEWILCNDIEILNVAGNCQTPEIDIESMTSKFLSVVFEKLGFQKVNNE